MPNRAKLVVKSSVIKTVDGTETRYFWWVTLGERPYSDKLGYESDRDARTAAHVWLSEHFPSCEVIEE